MYAASGQPYFIKGDSDMIFAVPYRLYKKLSVEQIAQIGMLKCAYVNGIVYDYTPRKLSRALKSKGMIVSERRLQQWVESLVKLGYCKLKDGNLKMLRVKPNKKHYRVSVSFSSYQELRNKLYLELMKNKSRQSYFTEQYSNFLGRNVSFKHSKANLSLTKRFKQTLKHEPSKIQNLSISYDGLCKLFNVSRSTSYRLISGLIKAGLIAKRKNLSYLGCGSVKALKTLKIQGVFTFKGMIYKREINEYQFL